MDLLAHLFGAGTPGPTDDYWYHPDGAMTPSGQRVDSDAAQKISAWYRGRYILASTVAMLPFPLYERLPHDGGAEPATDHPLYDVLHDTPNSWQDSFQWRFEKVCHVIDHGWAYDWIVPGARGFVHELQPIHPTVVMPEQIKRGPNSGRYLFHVRDEHSGQTTVHTQDEIFYLRGAGGKGILEYARTSLGTALATESYAAQIFSRGTLNGGVVEVPGLLNGDAAPRLAKSMVTGPGEWHIPKVLEQGAKWNQNTLTPEDAQMVLSRQFSIDDMARWLGVPRQMLENSDPSYGNAEQFDQSFLTYSMGGWLSLFEFAVNGQLVLNQRRYYAEFTRDAIARGKFTERAAGNVAYVNAGIYSVDEVRKHEGKNKRGGKADELREPQNITGKPAVDATTPQPSPRKRPATDADSGSKAEAIVVESAARVLRKEIAAVQKFAVRHAADQDAFAAAIAEFYAGHAEFVEHTLQLSPVAAREYCAIQAAQIVIGDWVAMLDTWNTHAYAAGLAALALDDAV